MGRFNFPTTIIILMSFSFSCMCLVSTAQLKRNFYAATCPNVETIVRNAVIQKIKQTTTTIPATIPATLRLFFHDCFVQGCDASVMIQSTPTNTSEKDHPENLSLAGDGFDTVVKARAAVDAVAGCKNKVSCADILALATRDVVALSGGPSYEVELGRFDGLSSTAASVEGRLPKPTFNLNQLNALFSSNGLNPNDMIALSAAHTFGFSHCDQFSNRIYNFSKSNPIDPTLNKQYASHLMGVCPKVVNPMTVTVMDPTTPITFDNVYFKNLQQGKGLFTSDQVLFEDERSRPVVDAWAANSQAFAKAFIDAMTKLGRVGVKNAQNGNIRLSCDQFN